MDDSDFESDEEVGLLRKALDVHLPDDFDPNKVPQTGEEYIHYVMYEAKRCKQLVVADIDKNKVKNEMFKVNVIGECVKAPKSMIPTLEWQTEKVADFEKLAKFLSKKLPEDTSNTELYMKGKVSTTTPKFSTIAELAEPSKIKLLQHIVAELDNVGPGSSFNYETGVWIYGILATLKIPLDPHTCHCLRDLARRCSVIRSKLAENCKEEIYDPLNLFICIIARYFKQLDLADNENDL